jgi:integrase
MEIPAANNERHVYLRIADLKRLLKAFADPEAAALAKMAFYTGLRWIEELLPLTQASIRKIGREVWLYVGDTKNGSPRMVPVHGAIRSCLKRLPFKKHWRTYYASFERAREAAGLPDVRMHDLRHSLASEIISSGGTLSDVHAALNHDSVVSAKRYAQRYPERVRHVMMNVGRR